MSSQVSTGMATGTMTEKSSTKRVEEEERPEFEMFEWESDIELSF